MGMQKKLQVGGLVCSGNEVLRSDYFVINYAISSINQSIIYLPTLTPKSTSARSKYARALKLQL